MEKWVNRISCFGNLGSRESRTAERLPDGESTVHPVECCLEGLDRDISDKKTRPLGRSEIPGTPQLSAPHRLCNAKARLRDKKAPTGGIRSAKRRGQLGLGVAKCAAAHNRETVPGKPED